MTKGRKIERTRYLKRQKVERDKRLKGTKGRKGQKAVWHNGRLASCSFGIMVVSHNGRLE